MNLGYPPSDPDRPADYAQHIIDAALSLTQDRLRHRATGPVVSLSAIQEALTLEMSQRSTVGMAVVWINAHNRVLCRQTMFSGTLGHCRITPRDVLTEALRQHAAGAVIAVNTVDGSAVPSSRDQLQACALRGAFALVDVRLVDYLIVAGGLHYSCAANGLV